MIRMSVVRPDSRPNGKYYFIHGYSGGGAPYGSHVTREEIVEQLTEKAGPGTLVDDGTDLWWEKDEAAGPVMEVGL